MGLLIISEEVCKMDKNRKPVNLYDVYKNGVLLHPQKSTLEVSEITGLKPHTVRDNALRGNVSKEGYLIVKSNYAMDSYFAKASVTFTDEWNEITKKLKKLYGHNLSKVMLIPERPGKSYE